MGRNNHFQFKQFRIVQEKAAMKVGIDGVLLGAWADLGDERRVLDVGAGTGLLSLMAAQRTNAVVDAVELEPEAAEEAAFNFSESPWAERLHVYTTAFQQYVTTEKYDHLISNPPFFDESSKAPDHKRAKARHADSLSLNDLIRKSVELLAAEGKLSMILPASKEENLREIARACGLKFGRLARIFPDETKVSHRILVEMSFNPETDLWENIYIRKQETGEYTNQYKLLTKDFYLAF